MPLYFLLHFEKEGVVFNNNTFELLILMYCVDLQLTRAIAICGHPDIFRASAKRKAAKRQVIHAFWQPRVWPDASDTAQSFSCSGGPGPPHKPDRE
jgi:hypothetical protein